MIYVNLYTTAQIKYMFVCGQFTIINIKINYIYIYNISINLHSFFFK